MTADRRGLSIDRKLSCILLPCALVLSACAPNLTLADLTGSSLHIISGVEARLWIELPDKTDTVGGALSATMNGAPLELEYRGGVDILFFEPRHLTFRITEISWYQENRFEITDGTTTIRAVFPQLVFDLQAELFFLGIHDLDAEGLEPIPVAEGTPQVFDDGRYLLRWDEASPFLPETGPAIWLDYLSIHESTYDPDRKETLFWPNNSGYDRSGQREIPDEPVEQTLNGQYEISEEDEMSMMGKFLLAVAVATGAGCATVSNPCQTEINDCLRRCDRAPTPIQPDAHPGVHDKRTTCEAHCHQLCY